MRKILRALCVCVSLSTLNFRFAHLLRASAIKILLIALCLSSVQLSTAQQITLKAADIPRIPTDTLPTDRDEVRIVTFSDGTFRFIPTNPWYFRGAPAYEANWDTVNLFAYRNFELRDLPERIMLEMPESHGYHAPATGKVLSKYGPRGRRAHNGTDISLAHGQPVYAAFDGIVRLSRWNSGGYGNIVIIRHPNGLETYYGHLSRRAVTADEWVRAGQVIGYGGRTGRASTNHLHFEVRYFDRSFDAERLFDFETGELRRRTFALEKEYFNIRSRAVEGIEEDPDNPAYAENGNADSNLSASTTPADRLSAAQIARQTAAAGSQAAERESVSASEPVYHRVVSGDTLLALAGQYGTTVAKICVLNNISRTTTLRIGRNLRIK
jgi:LysM repeat protein